MADNTTLTHEVLFHDIKIWIWCVIYVTRIITPIFFSDTINSQRYTGQILKMYVIRPEKTIYFSKMVQPPTKLPYVPFLLTKEFITLCGLLIHPT
jgi:hypothetical protein